MTDDSNNARRPSIATIFNPRRSKPSNNSGSTSTGVQLRPKNLHPRPSVVITDEDTPSQPLTLTNGVGDADGGGTGDLTPTGTEALCIGSSGSGGLQAITRDRSSTVSDRGVSVGVRGIGSRASSGSLNITGSGTGHRAIARQVRSPSINLTTSIPSGDNEQGGGVCRGGERVVRRSLCYRLGRALVSVTARKIVAGVFVTICVSASWVGATHLIKDLFQRQVPIVPTPSPQPTNTTKVLDDSHLPLPLPATNKLSQFSQRGLGSTVYLLPDQRTPGAVQNGRQTGSRTWTAPRSASLLSAVSANSNIRLGRNEEKQHLNSRPKSIRTPYDSADTGLYGGYSTRSYSMSSLPNAIAPPVQKAADKMNGTLSLNSTLQHISSKLSTGVTEYGPYGEQPGENAVFDAPLFTTWFCTAWTGLFFPLYLMCRCCACKDHSSLGTSLKAVATTFRDKGVTCSKLLSRSCLFSLLWVSTNYMYIYSLRILDCTDVMALYSAHVAFVYLLAWVILHEQFVGVRIVAVIMCNTGIALLAYMDGITRSTTLAGVVLAAASAAGSAVYKVLFKKVVGDASFGQVSVFFSVIALLNTLLLGPVVAALHLAGYEVIVWSSLPWLHLLLAAALTLVANILGNFGVAITFETFITLGLVLAIPVSGILDVRRYGVEFKGMKLAGIVLITCGFFLVLFPSDWPHYLTWFLRLGRHRKRHQQRQAPEPVDYRTGLISRSHLRSSSGLIR